MGAWSQSGIKNSFKWGESVQMRRAGEWTRKVRLTQKDGLRRRDFRQALSRQGRIVFEKTSHRKEE